MRRILYYSLLCLLWVSVNSCKDDEADTPPTPSLTVDRTTGLYQSTEFVFTIEQVSANAVSLLPYGADHVNDAGILVPASAFTDGKATVKFIYGKVGTFNAVVVANNHTGDGLSVKNSVSSSVAVTITSDRTAILEYALNGKQMVRGKEADAASTATEIDTVAHTIDVTVPYGTDVTTLKAKFKASDFSTVTVNDVAQTSETTANDFTSDKEYIVTSEDGKKSQNWTVHVTVSPIESDNTFKSFKGIISKKNKPLAGRVLPGSIDPTNGNIILYDTMGITPGDYDSVAVDYAVNGKFSYVRYGDAGFTKVGGKDTVDLSGSPVEFDIVPQDSTASAPDGIVHYNLFVAEAPYLLLNFGAPLNPQVDGKSDADWNLNMNVLNNTNTAAISTNFDFDAPDGMTILEIKADGNVVTDGSVINYKKPVSVDATVKDADGNVFTVRYTVSVTVLK